MDHEVPVLIHGRRSSILKIEKGSRNPRIDVGRKGNDVKSTDVLCSGEILGYQTISLL